MKIEIDKEIVNAFPSVGFYVFGIKGINNTDQNESFYANLKNHADNCLEHAKEEVYNLEIDYWKKRYKDMALSRKKGRSSLESLYTRYKKNKFLPKINPLVDLYNAISLKNGVCIGAYDYDKLSNYLILRYAKHGEEMLPIGSDKPIVISSKGVVYSDSKGIICSYWNYRDSVRTCVSEDSKNILIIIDVGANKELANNTASDIRALLKNDFDCTITDPIYVSAYNPTTTITL